MRSLRLLPGCQRGLRRRRGFGGGDHRFGRITLALQHADLQQAVRVIQRRPQNLAARNVLEGRRDAADGEEIRLGDRLGDRQARLRRAVGAQQQNRLVEIAARLGQRQRCQIGLIERGFAHDAVDQIGEAVAHRVDTLAGDRAEIVAKEPFCLFDGAFATTGCHIGHQSTSIFVERGMPTSRSASTR